MIGVVRPLTIRCKPRWNGAIIPLRVSWPSGKTQTTSPASSALPASRNAWRIIRGPPLGRDRDRTHRPQERPDDRVIEIRSIDDEPDRPVDAGDQEEAVGERDVVRHQQRPAGLGDVRPPDHPDSVKRVGQPDQEEPEEGVGDQGQRPEETGEQEQGDAQERPPRGDVEVTPSPSARPDPASIPR